MTEEDKDIQRQITDNILSGPHVVLIGAGATVAAIPNGDKFGRKSSVMKGFIKNIGMEDLFEGTPFDVNKANLEDVYSEMHDRPEYAKLCQEMEKRISDYYSSLVIPDEPTAYDYLVLSLRKKDWIFSFNWDNLLLQAYARCYRITEDLPQLVFLHGNVSVAYCSKCGRPQRKEFGKCCDCEGELIPVPLLYPVKNKDYTSSEYISKAWSTFDEILGTASVMTVFGYGAPKTDVDAVSRMRRAFAARPRWYSNFEVIDIAQVDTIYDSWSDFITAVHDHITIHSSIFDGTLMSEFPRRTIEGYVKRYYSGWWGTSSVNLKECRDLDSLKTILQPLLAKEAEGNFEVI